MNEDDDLGYDEGAAFERQVSAVWRVSYRVIVGAAVLGVALWIVAIATCIYL